MEILQRTIEEQGAAFGSSRLKREEKIRADRRIREEQDRAYHAALQEDKVYSSVISQIKYFNLNSKFGNKSTWLPDLGKGKT